MSFRESGHTSMVGHDQELPLGSYAHVIAAVANSLLDPMLMLLLQLQTPSWIICSCYCCNCKLPLGSSAHVIAAIEDVTKGRKTRNKTKTTLLDLTAVLIASFYMDSLRWWVQQKTFGVHAKKPLSKCFLYTATNICVFLNLLRCSLCSIHFQSFDLTYRKVLTKRYQAKFKLSANMSPWSTHISQLLRAKLELL